MDSSDARSLNLNIRGLRNSATVAINEYSNLLRAQGKRVFKLGLGQSPFPVPPWVVASLREHAHQKDYLPVRGLSELRRAVAGYHQRWDAVDRSADDVMVGPGSKELMFLLQLVLNFELIIPAPSWVSYAPQAQIIGRPVEFVPTRRDDGWAMTAVGLDAHCKRDPSRPRLLILNYPNNPTGATYSETELKDIANVAREYKLYVLSDEIYSQLHHLGQHVSIARFYPEHTIISNGLSKWCGAGGWRLGTFTFPPNLRWLLDAMSVGASETYTSTSAPIQYAAVSAFSPHPDLPAYLEDSRRILRALCRWTTTRLRQSGVDCGQPTGGFYLFAELTPFAASLAQRGIMRSRDLSRRILADTGVALLPGEDFGMAPNDLTLRIAYVDFDGAAALEAVRSVEAEPDHDFLTMYCGNVVTAIDLLSRWFDEHLHDPRTPGGATGS